MQHRYYSSLLYVLFFFPLFSFAQYQLNGSALRLDEDCFQLTPAQEYRVGSVWYLNQVNISDPFDLFFTFNLGCQDGNGADGMAFVLQQVSTNVGSTGEGLGYGAIQPSLAVELDTWQNGNRNDPVYDHLAIMANGVPDHNTSTELAGPVQILPNFPNAEDCRDHSLRVTWNPDSQIMRVFVDCELRLSYTGDIINNIFRGNGQVFWGFTAATGGFVNVQKFCVDYASFIQEEQEVAICKGDSVQLNVGQGESYSWSPATGLSSTSVRRPIAFPEQTTTYTVEVRNPCGITTRVNEITVVVNPLPVVTTSSDTLTCGGIPVPITAAGGHQYSWTPSLGLSDPTSATPLANPLQPTRYEVMVVDTVSGCVADGNVFVDALYADAGEDQAICIGTTAQLDASGGTEFQWAPINSLSQANISNPIASPEQSTDYIVAVTDARTACVDLDTVRVIVNPLPIPEITSPDDYVCSGGPSQLFATGGIGYQWRLDTTLSDLMVPDPIITPYNLTQDISTFHTYYVEVIDQNGCVNEDSFRVEVRLRPIMTISNDTVKCPDATVPLSLTGGVAYEWLPPMGLSDPSSPTPIANPVSTTTYTGIVTARWGCSEQDSLTVFVMEPEAGEDQSICPGENTELQAAGGVSYEWSPALDLTTPNEAGTVASPLTTTTYVVTVSDSMGCVDQDSMTLTVFPQPEVIARSDTGICIGGSVSLSAHGGAAQYNWQPAHTLSNPYLPNPVATPTQSSWYSVSITDGNDCVDTDSVWVAVFPLPAIHAGGDTTICEGGTATLIAEGGLLYSWTPAASIQNPSRNPTQVSPSSTTNFQVIGQDAHGCENTDIVQVQVVPKPQARVWGDSLLCLGQTTELEVSGAFMYLWSTGEMEERIEIAPTTDTTFWVVPIDSRGCEGDTLVQGIGVFQHPPAANFSMNKMEGFAPLQVNFTNLSQFATRFHWDFGDGHNAESHFVQHTFERPGSHMVTLIVDNEAGCPDTLTQGPIDVLDYLLFVPSAFSPNNDGKNDHFYVRTEALRDFYLEIYNRWGRKVAISQSEDFVWNGMSKGKDLPEGVYTYKITASTYGDRRIEKVGTITLIR